MGRGFEIVCKKCQYSFEINFGVGFLFPQIYQETMNAAKAGKFGKDVQGFLFENPDGALDCDQVLLQCTSCEMLDRGIDLSMYIPNDKPVVHVGKWSVACPFDGASYVAPWELKEHYQLMRPYTHICRECGNKMRVIKEDLFTKGWETKEIDETINVNCPKCHKPLTVGSYMMWD